MIKYITIPAGILQLDDVNDKQRLLLGMVVSFGDEGLRMGNVNLAELLHVHRNHITNLLLELEQKNYVEIINKQSRYRKILLSAKLVSTLTGLPVSKLSTYRIRFIYLQEFLKQKLISKEKNNNTTTFSFLLKNGTTYNLPTEKLQEYKSTYPGKDVEAELRKAAQWLKDNPNRRKTAKGMPRFLNGWLSRCNNQNSKPTGQQKTETKEPAWNNPTPEMINKIYGDSPTAKIAKKLMR
jgi:hypothetical protein